MPMKGFSNVLLGIVGTVVVGGGALVAVGEMSRLRMELAARQQTIARLSAQTEELQRQVEAVQGERKQVEVRLAQAREELDATTQEMTRLRNTSTSARLRAEELGNERDQLESQMTHLTRERDEAMEQVKQSGTEKAELERSVARLRERWKFLDRDYQHLAEQVKQMESQQAAHARQAGLPRPGQFGLVASTGPGEATAQPSMLTVDPAPSLEAAAPPIATALLPEVSFAAGEGQAPPFQSSHEVTRNVIHAQERAGQAIELPPIVVQKGQAWSGTGLRARVLEVNAQHRFVVLDKGTEDGIRVGTTFNVERGGGQVGAI